MIKTIKFKTIYSDEVGNLTFLEIFKDIAFPIKRMYYVYNVPKGVRRGNHAHKELTQILIALNGTIRINLDNGVEKELVILSDPDVGIIVEPGVWHTMEFITDQALLCVLAADYYDESDYIRSYNEFLSYMDKGYWKK